MHSLQSFFPRRYYVDKEGRRVFVGLTVEETSEFELLDNRDPFADGGSDGARISSGSHKKRWLELYHMQEEAWKIWRSRASDVNWSRMVAGQSTRSSQEFRFSTG
jgi:hypothetical protein